MCEILAPRPEIEPMSSAFKVDSSFFFSEWIPREDPLYSLNLIFQSNESVFCPRWEVKCGKHVLLHIDLKLSAYLFH